MRAKTKTQDPCQWNPFSVQGFPQAQAAPASAENPQYNSEDNRDRVSIAVEAGNAAEHHQSPYDSSASHIIRSGEDLYTQLARLVSNDAEPPERLWPDRARLAVVSKLDAFGLALTINAGPTEQPENTFSNYRGWLKKHTQQPVENLIYGVWVKAGKGVGHPHVHLMVECEPGDPVWIGTLTYARNREKRRHAAGGRPVRVDALYDPLGWLQYLHGRKNAHPNRVDAELAGVYASQSLRGVGNELNDADLDILERRYRTHV